MDFLFDSALLILTIILALIIGLGSIYILAARYPKKKKRYHPVGGTVIHQLLNFHRLHDYMTELAAKHKTYRLLSLLRSEVYTSDPVNVEYILKTNFANYGKGWYHHSLLEDLLGDGIFTVDGDKWRRQRKSSSYRFSTKLLRDFSSDVFVKNSLKLAHIVSEAAASEQAVEIQDLFMKSTLDSVFKTVLGMELDSMCGTNEEGSRFCMAFDEASGITLYRYVDIFWRIKRFLNLGSEKMLRESMKIVDEYVFKLIKVKIEEAQKSPHESFEKKGDILSGFLELKETDPKYLKDIILSFIIAGKDTTAATLSWFFYMLCRHPLLQEKIAKEIKEVTNLKDRPIFEEAAACLTDEVLDKLQYLHAALTETLRLYPAVPVDGKFCFSDDTLPDGFSVRKGDMVAYQSYAMGRMKFLWGDDAEDFRPERWLNENGTFKQESPFKFTTFQAGPRACLGKDFAYRQMKIFSAVLLSRFKFKMIEDKRLKYKTMLNLHIDGGLHVQAFPR